MYNGIGLKTARGSGTNGYVQRNLSNLKPRDNPFTKPNASASFNSQVRHAQPDAAILEHERKRRVEVKCMELRVQLEDDDVDDDEIEEQVSALREKLIAQLGEHEANVTSSSSSLSQGRKGNTHEQLEAKRAEDRRFATAMRVEGEYREGDAFDRELQERKKQQRVEERRREWEARRELRSKAKEGTRDDGWKSRQRCSASPGQPRRRIRIALGWRKRLAPLGQGEESGDCKAQIQIEVEFVVLVAFTFPLDVEFKIKIKVEIAIAIQLRLLFAFLFFSLTKPEQEQIEPER